MPLTDALNCHGRRPHKKYKMHRHVIGKEFQNQKEIL